MSTPREWMKEQIEALQERHLMAIERAVFQQLLEGRAVYLEQDSIQPLETRIRQVRSNRLLATVRVDLPPPR